MPVKRIRNSYNWLKHPILTLPFVQAGERAGDEAEILTPATEICLAKAAKAIRVC